jgi:hypothetical protein
MNAKFIRIGQNIINLELITRTYYSLPLKRVTIYFGQDCLTLEKDEAEIFWQLLTAHCAIKKDLPAPASAAVTK